MKNSYLFIWISVDVVVLEFPDVFEVLAIEKGASSWQKAHKHEEILKQIYAWNAEQEELNKNDHFVV